MTMLVTVHLFLSRGEHNWHTIDRQYVQATTEQISLDQVIRVTPSGAR